MARRWTEEEIRILKEHYPTSRKEKLFALLPNKTHIAIFAKAKRLKIKRLLLAKTIFISKEELKKMYIDKELSSIEIAKKLNISRSSIKFYLQKHKLSRSISEAKKLSWKKNKGNYIKGLTGRKCSKFWKLLPKGKLEELYWKKRLSSKDIAEMYKTSESTIWGWMKKYDIPRRSFSEVCEMQRGKHVSPKTEFKKGNVPWWIKRGLKNPAKIPSILKKMLNIRTPNKIEMKLMSIIKKNLLPFKFVGNGDFILGGKCPDFLDTNGKKKVIELFGSYWHSPLFNPKVNWNRTYDVTIKHYRKYGFDCLIIWDYELKRKDNVINKIENFINS